MPPYLSAAASLASQGCFTCDTSTADSARIACDLVFDADRTLRSSDSFTALDSALELSANSTAVTTRSTAADALMFTPQRRRSSGAGIPPRRGSLVVSPSSPTHGDLLGSTMGLKQMDMQPPMSALPGISSSTSPLAELAHVSASAPLDSESGVSEIAAAAAAISAMGAGRRPRTSIGGSNSVSYAAAGGAGTPVPGPGASLVSPQQTCGDDVRTRSI